MPLDSAARPAPGDIDLLDPRLRPMCAAYLAADHVPGASIAIVAGDKGYHLAYGVKSAGGGDPVTAATGFNIGSCSKAFASATLASLAAEGLARWDDPVTDRVPEFALHDPRVTAMTTLRDLSANRIGLPRVGLTEYGMDPSRSAEHLLERLRHTPPMAPFRDRFGYVNAGHTAVALAAGRITGKGFLPTLRERILEPLGMTATSGGAAAERELSDMAGWHVIRDGKAIEVDRVFTDQYLASGGMVVSGADAVRWLRLHLNGGLVDGVQVIPREALLETHRPHSMAVPGKDIVTLFYPDARMAAYALGWAVSDFEGRRLVCHSGSDVGVAAMTVLLPDDGIGVAVYTNANAPGGIMLAHAVAATLLGLPPRDWRAYFQAKLAAAAPPPDRTPSEGPTLDDPSGYAGDYVHPADGLMTIEASPDGLAGNMRDAYRGAFRLAPAGGARFKVAFDYVGHPVPAGDEGPAVAFVVEDGRAVAAEFRVVPGFPRVFGRVQDGGRA